MNLNESDQLSVVNNRRYVVIGLSLGLVLGGLLGFLVGFLLDDSPFYMILGAGGGMVIGLAFGRAWNQRMQNHTP
jgi:O-antigen/teichoic acid export membrane protein